MGADSGIEWTDDTVNFWWGCSEVSPACDLCYARRLDSQHARRFGRGTHWNDDPRLLRAEKAAAELARNNRRAIREGRPRRQFINSMSDFFENKPELKGPRLIGLEAIRLAGDCACLLLTKRPHLVVHMLTQAAVSADFDGNAALAKWLRTWVAGEPPDNVQIGVTAENQEWLEHRFKHLVSIPARVRFLSCEPLLGPLDLLQTFNRWVAAGDKIPGTTTQTWPALRDYLRLVIVGGESDDRGSRKARPMHPDWARKLRDDCDREEVLFHFKQWGDCVPSVNFDPEEMADLRIDSEGRDVTDLPGLWDEPDVRMDRVGKKAAGRILDGRTWDDLPEVGINV
jgi:protein gp37